MRHYHELSCRPLSVASTFRTMVWYRGHAEQGVITTLCGAVRWRGTAGQVKVEEGEKARQNMENAPDQALKSVDDSLRVREGPRDSPPLPAQSTGTGGRPSTQEGFCRNLHQKADAEDIIDWPTAAHRYMALHLQHVRGSRHRSACNAVVHNFLQRH